MILSALISSISKTILAYVVKYATSHDVWTTLECMFISQSRARSMSIHYQLATLRKGDSSISDYFHRFTHQVDTLAAIAQPLPLHESLTFLLASLGSDYDSLSPLSKHKSTRLLLKIFMVICSLMNFDFLTINLWLIYPLPLQTLFTRAHPLVVVVVDAPSIPPLLFVDAVALILREMQALLATPQQTQDSNWYPDSGATHHVISDLANLNLHADEYHGSEQIRVGNGSGFEASSVTKADFRHRGYKCFHVSTNRLYISRDVIFQENSFPFSLPATSPTHGSPASILGSYPGLLQPMHAQARVNSSTSPTRTVGALQYLSITHPDIAFAVNKLSQFMHKPTQPHWQSLKRLLRYLKSTIQFGLHIYRSSCSTLQTYSDADWANNKDDRRSTGSFCIFLGKNLISWGCRKQATVARSSTEASTKILPTLLQNSIFHAKTKHIEIDFHFVCDMVASKCLNVRFVSNTDQLADLLTKPISSSRFALLRTKLNVLSIPLGLRGRVKDNYSEQCKESQDGCLVCERGKVKVVGLGAMDGEAEEAKRENVEKTKMRERRDRAAMDG
uniref:Retroviral polymerase SH3-like domain-containing protein n=1 Tax=Fagus sylvatica TaxID=28930 RepID=A0A2N9IKQ2_FAGSY